MGNSESSSNGGNPRHPHATQQGQGWRSVGSTTTRFRAIADNFSSIEQVQAALRTEGLESSNLILALDMTKSNEWTGKHCCGGRSLHYASTSRADFNPYERAVDVIGSTLETFDDDRLIPCYGFGDATTQDKSVFSFMPGDAPLHGLQAVMERYRDLMPAVRLAGPTSFAPAIERAMQIVWDSGCQFHILLLIADGQVTRSSDLPSNRLSIQEDATVRAIVAASKLPMSIVMVGVGDGPWDLMREFDDRLPARDFDNFQFVNFTEILQMQGRGGDTRRQDALFALRALMEVPDQYKAIMRLGLLGNRRMQRPGGRPPLPPPAPPRVPAPVQYSMHQSQGGAPVGLPYAAHGAPYGQVPQAGAAAAHLYAANGGAYAAASPYSAQAYGAATAPAVTGQQQWQQPAAQQHGQCPAQPPPQQPRRTDGSVDDSMALCPITQERMRDPVIAADGFTYERSAIDGWLRSHDTSPMTNARLEHKNLIPNRVLKSALLEAQW